MKIFSDKYKFDFPYLYDETQEVAKNYNAVCTPDFFGFDKDLKLKYRGRIDSGVMNSNQNSDIERDAYGVSFAVNENLSVGMGVSNVEYDAKGNDEESTEYGATYTSGGMTIGFQNITKDNINGTAVDHEMTELMLTFAF